MKATKIGLAAGARDEWHGPFREDFDTETAQFTGDSQAIQERLNTTAAAVRDAIDAAATEQTRRAQAQQDWDAEARREVEASEPHPSGAS